MCIAIREARVTSTRYRIVQTGITAQNIDGEVIVIHMGTGKYFSLTGAAAHVWEALAKPRGAAELAGMFSDLPADGRAAIEGVLATLQAESLIAPADVPADSVSTVCDALHPWQHPKVEGYGDMQDLLLADPIHDVDEQGWPSLPPAPKA